MTTNPYKFGFKYTIMNRIINFALILLLFSSCRGITGSGHIIIEERNPGQFTGIHSAGSIDVEIKKGPEQMVKIEGDDNILQYVITTTEKGILTVNYKSNISFMNVHVKVYVTSPTLNKIYVSGSAGIVAKDTLFDPSLIDLNIGGSGEIKAIVKSPSIVADVSGSGSLTLSGLTKNFNANVSGSGDIKCHELMSENTVVKVEGSGSAHVYASVAIDADVSGSGDIFYRGNPGSPKISKSGSGSVQAEK